MLCVAPNKPSSPVVGVSRGCRGQRESARSDHVSPAGYGKRSSAPGKRATVSSAAATVAPAWPVDLSLAVLQTRGQLRRILQ